MGDGFKTYSGSILRAAFLLLSLLPLLQLHVLSLYQCNQGVASPL